KRRNVKAVDDRYADGGREQGVAPEQSLPEALGRVHQPIVRRMRSAAESCTKAMRAASTHTTADKVSIGWGTTLGVMAPTARTTGLVRRHRPRTILRLLCAPNSSSSTSRAMSR